MQVKKAEIQSVRERGEKESKNKGRREETKQSLNAMSKIKKQRE